jgi:hypothetical protein
VVNAQGLLGIVLIKRITVKRLLFFAILSILLAGCVRAAATAPPRPTKTMFKGMELYSWKDETGSWHFSLLPGTNRNKSITEVTNSSMSLDEIPAAFDRLAEGEVVFWGTQVETQSSEKNPLELPPIELQDRLKEAAKHAKISLILPGD